jgi:hypothetical protein
LSITEIIKSLQKEAEKQRKQECDILGEIAAVETMEFAEQVARTLSTTTHAYSFEEYLARLDTLRTLLFKGIPKDAALNSVQNGWDIEALSDFWRNRG